MFERRASKLLVAWLVLLCPAWACAQPAQPNDPGQRRVATTNHIDWNSQQVEWHDYPDGLARMRADNKGAILIVYADWCGVCKRYSEMFRDPEVVKQSKHVVLIRINQDTSPYAKDFSFDGSYVPRTFILDKRGKVLASPFGDKKHGFFLPPGHSDYLVKLFSYMGGNKSGEWSR